MRSTPTIEEEHPPSSEELNTILDHGNQRTRAATVLIAYTGIRPEAISRLKLGDFSELDINGKMQPRKVPMIVKVRAELSKNKRPYFTFLGKRGVEYLVAYFEERIASGEKLTPESPAITVPMRMMAKGKVLERGDHMGRKAVSALMRRAIRSSNTSVSTFRPYMLRGYYDWALQNAGLSHVWEQFLMGHSGPIEEEYSVRKRLTDEQVEKMRAAFSDKVESLLVGRSGDGMTQEEVEKKIDLKHYWMGIEESPMKVKSPEDILKEAERWREEPLTVDEKIAILREEYLNLKAGVENMMEDHDRLVDSKQEGGNSQKVVSEQELEGYLSQGWSVVLGLPSGKIVVKK